MLTTIRTSLSLLLIAALSACSTYHLDPNAPQAKVVAKDYMFMNNQNEVMIAKDYKTCQPLDNLASHGSPVAINANRPTTLAVLHVIGYTNLIYAFTFVPKQDRTYLIVTKKKETSHENDINSDIGTTLFLYEQKGEYQKNVTTEKLTQIPFIPREFQIGPHGCLDADTDVLHKRKVLSITETAQDVPPVYQWFEHIDK